MISALRSAIIFHSHSAVIKQVSNLDLSPHSGGLFPSQLHRISSFPDAFVAVPILLVVSEFVGKKSAGLSIFRFPVLFLNLLAVLPSPEPSVIALPEFVMPFSAHDIVRRNPSSGQSVR